MFAVTVRTVSPCLVLLFAILLDLTCSIYACARLVVYTVTYRPAIQPAALYARRWRVYLAATTRCMRALPDVTTSCVAA